MRKWLLSYEMNTVNIIQIHGLTIEIVRRPYRRKMTLTARTHGPVRLLINQSLPDREVHNFLHASKQWLEKVYQQRKELESQHPLPRFQEGEKFPFLGEERELLKHLVKPNLEEKKFQRQLKKFYEEQGQLHIFSSVETWSARMNLKPSKYKMRYQKSRWGACNSHGEITLNLKLVAAPEWVIDYVVVHELAHLKVFNHSKAFWALVSEYLPEYKKAQHWLKTHQPRLDRFFAYLMQK